MNLDNLARRVVLPVVGKDYWHGWYSLRRGIGTLVTSVAKDAGLAAKGLLRHESVATTTAHYVKDVPEDTRRALQQVEQLLPSTMLRFKNMTEKEESWGYGTVGGVRKPDDGQKVARADNQEGAVN